jgi:hypothetical protein
MLQRNWHYIGVPQFGSFVIVRNPWWKQDLVPEGPWDHEPDYFEWRDEATGYPCRIRRNPVGALCGYVGVDSSSQYWQLEYDDVDVTIHGGLTYSSHEEGSHEHWFLGFDCAHYGDLTPTVINVLPSRLETDTYRDLEYVRQQCIYLAWQLSDK